MSLLLNVGAAVTGTFGPMILEGVVGNKYTASLLNAPFGFIQLVSVFTFIPIGHYF